MGGINPARVQQVLSQATDQQLMQMLKRPDKIPSMFIQQEIAKRRQMRMAANAEKSKYQQLTGPSVMPANTQFQGVRRLNQPVGMHAGGAVHQHPHAPATPIAYDRGDPRDIGLSYFPNILQGVYAANPALAKSRNILVGQSPYKAGQTDSRGLGFLPIENIPMEESVESEVTKFGNRNQEFINVGGKQIKNPNYDPTLPKTVTRQEKYLPYKQGVIGQFAQGRTRDEAMQAMADQPQGATFEEMAKHLAKQEDADDQTSDEISSLENILFKGNVNTNFKLPDNSGLNTTISNLEKTVNESYGTAKNIFTDREERYKKGITDAEAPFDKHIKNLEKQKSDYAALFNTKEIENLFKSSEEHAQKAIDFVNNDKTIVEAQKKLIEAMQPHQTPTQRFFGYVAQIGADIMGSDRDSFLEAGGEAISQALKDYKFDTEQDRERFINSAKLMLDFEYAKRDNTIKAMEMKSQLYGVQVDNLMSLNEMKRSQITGEATINDKIFQAESAKVDKVESFKDKIDQNDLNRLNLDTSHMKNLLSIVSAKDEIEQKNFANQLSVANHQLDVMQVMNQNLTPEIRNFAFRNKLPEESKAVFDSWLKSGSSSNLTPDRTAAGFRKDTMTAINKLVSEQNISIQEASISVLGEDLFNRVKTADGNQVDLDKLYQHAFSATYNAWIVGGVAQDVIHHTELTK